MFALRVRDGQGAVILDSSDFTYEVIYNTVLDWSVAGNSIIETTLTIAGFDPATCVFCMFLEYPGNYNPTSGVSYPGLPYVYPFSGNQITLRSATPGDVSSRTFANGVYRLMAFRML